MDFVVHHDEHARPDRSRAGRDNGADEVRRTVSPWLGCAAHSTCDHDGNVGPADQFERKSRLLDGVRSLCDNNTCSAISSSLFGEASKMSHICKAEICAGTGECVHRNKLDARHVRAYPIDQIRCRARWRQPVFVASHRERAACADHNYPARFHPHRSDPKQNILPSRYCIAAARSSSSKAGPSRST